MESEEQCLVSDDCVGLLLMHGGFCPFLFLYILLNLKRRIVISIN
jgi:hypothetical protein